MAAKSPVVLILGAGPNIGQALVRIFASKGYKVALAARSLKEADSTDNQLNIPSDFSKTDDVVNAFTKVKKVFGIPSVVIYNGKPWLVPEDAFEFLLKIRSQRLDAHPTSGPVRPSTGRFQSRCNNQCH
jgi:NAD(P)-dependent dehydrogenase (short-subunit alcohol dehydrogenase family)